MRRVKAIWSFGAILLAGVLAGCIAKPFTPPPPSIIGLWLAESIAGTPVPQDSRITLSLYANGKAVGRSGCNNYSGTYKRSGDAVTFAPFVATMMACAEDVMGRERLYFDTMTAATRLAVSPEGVLVISTESGAEVRFHRQESTALSDARSRGVNFRGIGQEPGWVLELKDGGEITALLDYGARSITLPTPRPKTVDGALIYDASSDTDHLVLNVRGKPCVDAMSGEPHATVVEMTVNDQLYTGCGDWLD